VRVEQRWAGRVDANAWRKPDVAAEFNGLRLAFEIQTSSTFVDVIRARMEFYRNDGALVAWILPSFEPERRRQFEDDVVFSNNSNALVVTEQTARISIERRVFTLRCHYCEPVQSGNGIKDEWRSELMTFDQLQTNHARQQLYFYDYAGAQASLLAHQKLSAKVERDDALRAQLEAFWLENGGDTHGDAARERYAALRQPLRERGIVLPLWRRDDGFRSGMRFLLSAKHGRPIGFGFSRLVQVAHQVAGASAARRFLYPFVLLLVAHGTARQLDEEDHSGKWRAKRAAVKALVKEERSRPRDDADKRLLPILSFAFPEIAEKL